MTSKGPAGTTEIVLRLDAPMLARVEREVDALNRGGNGRPASLEYAVLMILRREMGMERRSAADGVGLRIGGASGTRGVE